jgi:hypothetical protein
MQPIGLWPLLCHAGASGLAMEMTMGGLEFTLGTPRILMDDFGYFPSVWRLPNGALIVTASQGEDVEPSEKVCLQIFTSDRSGTVPADSFLSQLGTPGFSNWHAISTDEGRTWTRKGFPTGNLTVLKDGTLLVYHMNTQRIVAMGDAGPGEHFIASFWRSHDLGEHWSGPEQVPFHGPLLRSERPYESYSPMFLYRNLLEREDGAWLMLAYGWFEGDRKYRCVLYRSMDRGRTFSYYSTVASDDAQQGREGCDDPVMIPLGKDELLCIYRTGSYLPMKKTISHNGGASWDHPVPVGVDGVDPDLLRLGNGVLVCSFGRPGVGVVFCDDPFGEEWRDRTQIFNGIVRQGHLPGIVPLEERSCCYTGIAATGTDSFLLVYSAPDDLSNQNAMDPWISAQLRDFRIWGVDITVERCGSRT